MAVHRRATIQLLSLFALILNWTNVRSITAVSRRRRQQDITFGGGRYSYNANPWLTSSFKNDDQTRTSSKGSKGMKSLTSSDFPSPSKDPDPKFLPGQQADASTQEAKQSALPTTPWRSSPAPLTSVPLSPSAVPSYFQTSLPGNQETQSTRSPSANQSPGSKLTATRNPTSRHSSQPSAITPSSVMWGPSAKPKRARLKDPRPSSLPSWPGSSPPPSPPPSPLTPKQPLPGVSGSPSTVAEQSTVPSSAADSAVPQSYSVEPSPFMVTYFAANYTVPTQFDLDQAQTVTLVHLKYCIGEKYNTTLDIALLDGSTVQGNPMILKYHIVCDLLISASHVPDRSEVDSVLEACLSGTSRQRLLNSLALLPDTNLFSTTQSLIYSKDTGVDESIETNHESNDAKTLSMIAIAGMIVAAMLFSIASLAELRSARDKHDRTVRPRYCRRAPARRIKEYATHLRLSPRHEGSTRPREHCQLPYHNDVDELLQDTTLIHCKENALTEFNDHRHMRTIIPLESSCRASRSTIGIGLGAYDTLIRQHGRTMWSRHAQSNQSLVSSGDDSCVSHEK